MRYAYFVVEGPHDVSFLGRVLRDRGLKLTDTKSKLDAYWRPLLPTAWPIKQENGDLMKRVRVPRFFESADWSVAVDAAEGDSQLVDTAIGQRDVLTNPALIEAVGVVLDADKATSVTKRFETVRDGLAKGGLPTADSPGIVAAGPPRCGLFVLPDNASAGTLEELLLDAAATNYPSLLALARPYVVAAGAAAGLNAKDLMELKKPAGNNKAIVGAVASILKPGKSIQVSLDDNRWVDAATLALPRLAAFKLFVDRLMP